MLALFLFLLRICILFLLCSATDDFEDDPDDDDDHVEPSPELRLYQLGRISI